MNSLTGRDLLTLNDLSSDELTGLLDLAAKLKAGEVAPQCPGKVLGLLFSKASTRTRVSFSVAMYQMGGQIVDLNPSVTQVGRGEPLVDTARVLDRYVDAIAIRTFEQSDLQTFADCAEIPVINALTDLAHPCQTLADLQTMHEAFGQLAGLTLTYIGDGNNVAHSLMLGCALAGVHVRIATPENFEPLPEITELAKQLAGDRSDVVLTPDVKAASEGAHALYTDVWASMGQETEADDRAPIFADYQINDKLIGLADPESIVLHCLPAHRGEEITEAAMEGSHSRIWDQAENRMHAQKALLASLLGLV
mgnify:CR=1 FL=1